MKKFCAQLAVAACSLLFLQVSADNNYCCPQTYDPCCCMDEVGFEGFYLGINLGVSSHEAHRNDLDGFLTDNSGWSTIDTSFTIGGQIGYDWQCNNALFGLVADANWVDHDLRLQDNPNSGSADNYIKNEINWFTTLRAKAGLTVCDAAIYLTAGAAVTQFKTQWNDNPDHFSHSNTRWGWTGGLGTEFLIGCNWSLGAEVLYMQFSNDNRTFTAGSTDFAFGHSDSLWVGRVILNYRFGDLCSCWCCN